MLSDYRNDYLTPYEVADEFGISLTTVYNLLRSDRIPDIKIGRVWRIPIEKLDRYVYGSNYSE